MSFFDPPQLIEAEVFATLPASLRKKGAPSTWVDANHPGSRLDAFLEGPAFDRDGNLYRGAILAAKMPIAGKVLYSHL